MRLKPFSLFLASVLVVAAACSNTTANNGTGAGGGNDATATDLGAGTDTSKADGAGPDVPNDTVTADADAAGGTDTEDEKTGGSDALEDVLVDTTDVAAPDADADDADGGPADIDVPDVPDVETPDVPDVAPGSCTTDADCLGLNFAPCLIGYCDATSKMCKIKPAADGTACATGGSCGGPGTCKTGSCDAPSTCKPDVCSPQQIECGTKVVIELSTLGASAFGGYGDCSSQKWDGPEAAILLNSDVTLTATLSLEASGVTADVELFDIAPTLDGKCDTAACDSSSYYSLTIGLPANTPRIVFLDSSAADTGTVTLSLDCTAATFCGDTVCDANESCSICQKDCGTCATSTTCGDKTCDATEDCASCPADCGKCDPGCAKNTTAGCNGCSCEACVCTGPQPNYPNGDAFCCATAWDSSCIKECQGCGTNCPVGLSSCGDGNCDWGNEDSTTCPNDCFSSFCGDGICDATGGETCAACTQDCGFCLVAGFASSGCGDGKCGNGEDCTNCAADCGTCGDFSCACLADATCCTEGFGFFCQDTCNTCIKANGGGSCPVSNCGDGVCSGETCKTCSEDCGACPAYCGDGNCDPGEDKTTCIADCATGCQGKCGSSSKEADGSFCWCDAACTDAGDCCSDKTTFCP